jgi:hypothetical protein
MVTQAGRVLYWLATATAIVLTIYLEALLGPQAVREAQWTMLVLIVILGFLIWSVGLAISRLLCRQ